MPSGNDQAMERQIFPASLLGFNRSQKSLQVYTQTNIVDTIENFCITVTIINRQAAI